MSKVLELLDAAKKRQAIKSDYALAQALGVGRQHVSNWRTGTNRPKPVFVLQLAVMAGLDPVKTLAAIEEEDENDPTRKEWLRNFRNAACWVGMAIATFLFSPVENTQAATMPYAKNTAGIQIIAVLNAVVTSVRRVSHTNTLWVSKNRQDSCPPLVRWIQR
jgi:transcriptional regulator with XRE-family HTH domain